MDTNSYISLKQLAEELGMDRSHCRRYVLKLGVEPQKHRTEDSGNQLALTVTAEEAEMIRQRRSEGGFLDSTKPVESNVGVFYIIQLVPELDPKRIKFGFADDAASRLGQHRTSAPTATVLKTWPCRRSWEGTIIDALSSFGCNLIMNEVFECSDLDTLTAKADELFSLLPDPTSRPSLSRSSPFNQ